jgi:hypothetical protein
MGFQMGQKDFGALLLSWFGSNTNLPASEYAIVLVFGKFSSPNPKP